MCTVTTCFPFHVLQSGIVRSLIIQRSKSTYSSEPINMIKQNCFVNTAGQAMFMVFHRQPREENYRNDQIIAFLCATNTYRHNVHLHIHYQVVPISSNSLVPVLYCAGTQTIPLCPCPLHLSTIGRTYICRQSQQQTRALRLLIVQSSSCSCSNSNITKSRPCNIQQYFTAVKMFIFR